MPGRTPADCHTQWLQAFNAGDLAQMLTFYEPECLIIPEPGTVLTGTDAVRQVLQGFLALKGTMEMRPRPVLQCGDLALLVSDWTLAGTAADGSPVSVGGTTADVVRRQADGTWRFAIDNPLGIQGVKQAD
jgi:uncharacterized protein (TIGR02246 family)